MGRKHWGNYFKNRVKEEKGEFYGDEVYLIEVLNDVDEVAHSLKIRPNKNQLYDNEDLGE